MTTQTFDFQPRTRIVFGPDKLDALGELTRQLGVRRALLVSDPGIVHAGHTQRGLDALRRSEIETQLFDQVHENPTTENVDVGVVVARRYEPEVIIGLGGGSSMDCAKAINFLYTNGGRMRDYWGIDKAQRPMLPMIAVPTTAGTGSESQSFALITDAQTGAKMACGDKKAAFRIALLDPKLTLTQPARVTALTGIDAIAHAVETHVTRPRNPVSLLFSREAWRLLSVHFPRVLDDPEDLSARGGVQLGACLAGLAIENSMLGAAHALANPLTSNYGIVHGQAVGIMLPHVVRFNRAEVAKPYAELHDIATRNGGSIRPSNDPDGLAGLLGELVARTRLSSRLSDCGVPREALPRLADAASQEWTRKFNPREVDRIQLLEIYEQAF